MKARVTKKAIRESYPVKKIWCIGYCNLQYLLNYRSPFAYSARAEGWACDYYEIGNGICISTGYAPIGIDVPYEIQKKYDNKAMKIVHSSTNPCAELDALIDEFITEVERVI